MEISLTGWVVFYAGLLSVVGELVKLQQMPGQFGLRMGVLFGMAAIVCLVVFGLALRRWARHFVENARLFGPGDVVMMAAIGLVLGSVIWFSAHNPA